MENGVAKYYSHHDTSRKDSKGFNGVYDVIDRETGEVMNTFDQFGQAQDKITELIKKDKISRGERVIDLIEIPFSHRDRSKAVTEILPVTVYK